MDREAYAAALFCKSMAAAKLVGVVDALLALKQVPEHHRERCIELLRQYHEAEADAQRALDAPAKVAA